MGDFEQAVAVERAFIVSCRDVGSLLDRMAEYREHLRAAIGREDTLQRLRLGDLLELAEDRITRLKREADEAEEQRAIAWRRRERHAPPSRASDEDPEPAGGLVARAQRQSVSLAPPPRVVATEDRSVRRLARMRAELDAERASRESADRAFRRAEERAAAAERAAAELEAVQAQLVAEQGARLRAEIERAEAERVAAEREAALRTSRAKLHEYQQQPPARPEPVPVTPTAAKAAAPPPAGAVVVDTAAPSRAPVANRTPATTVGDAPLTGADLARFRAARGITQRAAATLLGVALGVSRSTDGHTTQ